MPHTGNRADKQARDRFGKFRDEGNSKNLAALPPDDDPQHDNGPDTLIYQTDEEAIVAISQPDSDDTTLTAAVHRLTPSMTRGNLYSWHDAAMALTDAANHPNAGPNTLRAILEATPNDGEMENIIIVEHALANPNTPTDTRARWNEWGDMGAAGLASNPSLTADEARSITAADRDGSVTGIGMKYALDYIEYADQLPFELKRELLTPLGRKLPENRLTPVRDMETAEFAARDRTSDDKRIAESVRWLDSAGAERDDAIKRVAVHAVTHPNAGPETMRALAATVGSTTDNRTPAAYVLRGVYSSPSTPDDVLDSWANHGPAAAIGAASNPRLGVDRAREIAHSDRVPREALRALIDNRSLPSGMRREAASVLRHRR